MKVSIGIFSIALAVAVLLMLSPLQSQPKEVKGTVTYIAGGSVYTSLGKKDGVQDSTILFVLQKNDTAGILKVFAVSSKSSVCSILQSKRSFQIGDSVFGYVAAPQQVANNEQATKSITVQNDTITPQPKIAITDTKYTGLFSLSGRMSLQYFTSSTVQTHSIATQRGLILNLRGRMNRLPLKFDLYGNFRSSIEGTQSPFASAERNQTRIYRVSVDYEDSLYLFSLGRIMPASAPSVGYIDGGLVARKFNDVTFGITAGFQPEYSDRVFSTDYKKISLFMNYQNRGRSHTSIGAAYARTYYQTTLDRELFSSSFYSLLTDQFSLSGQAELSLRSKSGNNFELSPSITTLFSMLNYRISTALSFGAGYTAWSPSYSYSAIRTVPDSMLDTSTRGSLMTSANLSFANGITFTATYTPRSSKENFGKEFSTYSSLGWSNFFHTGIYGRIAYSINSTVASKTHGIGAYVQKSFGQSADVTLRYQFYRHSLDFGTNSSHSYGIDATVFLLEKLSLWGSIEGMQSFGVVTYNVISELSWRF